jgi:hypothetical protein
MVRQLQILVATSLFWPAVLCLSTLAQKPSYPTKIRGYKVERAVVEVKKQQKKSKETTADQQRSSESDSDALIRFGDAQLARVTPLGITLEIPIVVAPVQQKGRVDFLIFEDMVVNDIPVQIDEYRRTFDLPNKEELTLREPVRFYIYLPSAVLAAVDEWSDSKERWLVTGRVYVFGNFKKFTFSFKRCIPVELNITMRNPLRE